MWDSRIRLKPAKQAHDIQEIGSSTHHCLHQTTDCTCIWHASHFSLVSWSLRIIFNAKAMVLNDRCINEFSLTHVETFYDLPYVRLLRESKGPSRMIPKDL